MCFCPQACKKVDDWIGRCVGTEMATTFAKQDIHTVAQINASQSIIQKLWNMGYFYNRVSYVISKTDRMSPQEKAAVMAQSTQSNNAAAASSSATKT